jgi:hypothetical protein
MPLSNFSTLVNFSTLRNSARFSARALAATCALSAVAVAATVALPIAPQTFDTSYAAPTGATIKVDAGGNLQAALDNAQLGDTIVLQAGATFTGPFRLPNKTTGTGWIYVVSSNLASLPPPGQRVGPGNAANMPKIVAPAYNNAVVTVAGSHHFRFVGVEIAPAPGAYVYNVVIIGNGKGDTSPTTLPQHIVFDRCYVHGDPVQSDRRGIMMNGAYIAIVDSYISDFKENGADTQALGAYNTTGPLKIVDDYIEAAGENVIFGGADSLAPSLVPSDIDIENNHFFKPLSLMGTQYTVKNLLELKAAKRVLVSGNTFQNNPGAAQAGFALLITPRNQGGNAPWSTTTDIAIVGNTFINIGSGLNIAGFDSEYPSYPTTNPGVMTVRVLVRNNVIGVTGLQADGRAFMFTHGGSDYTIDHNTIINTAYPPKWCCSDIVAATTGSLKVDNFVFINNLSTPTAYGVLGADVGQGTKGLNGGFSNWTFSKNALIGAPASLYPTGNYFPTTIAAIRFTDYSAGNYSLAAGSPYKNAGTDGLDIGADLSNSGVGNTAGPLPNPPANVAVK